MSGGEAPRLMAAAYGSILDRMAKRASRRRGGGPGSRLRPRRRLRYGIPERGVVISSVRASLA